MFVKGMKYELRSVSRIVLPMLIIFLCAAMLMSLSFMLDGRILGFSEKAEESDSLLSSLFYLAETALVGGTILLVVVINITVYILIVYRFYVSFFTDEGYLTFTLPLTIDCHLAIKIASMFFWMAASLITTLIGGIIILGGLIIGYADFHTVGQAYDALPVAGYGLMGGANAIGAGSALHVGPVVPDDQAIDLIPLLTGSDLHRHVLREGVGGVELPVYGHGHGIALASKQEHGRSDQKQDSQQDGNKDQVISVFTPPV